MVSLLCVSDLHDNEAKLKQVAGFAKSGDAIITAGDDLDKELPEQQYEANALLAGLMKKHQPKSGATKEQTEQLNTLFSKLQEKPAQEEYDKAISFIEKNPELKELLQAERGIKKDYISHFAKRADAINDFYKKAGIPGFGTAGNHDPLPALGRISTIKYLLGETTDFKGLSIAGLPATGEWTQAAGAFPDFYPHLQQYSPAIDNEKGEPSDLAKRLLEHNGKIDVFVTHKAYRKDLQDWDPAYAEQDAFGVDAGAQAIDEKFHPTLNVFGHYHLARARIKRSEDGNQWFLFVGPNASVRVDIDNAKKPMMFESFYYN